MAIKYVSSALIADAAPTAGSASTSGEHDIGDDTLVRGAWIFTTLGATALAATPTAGKPRFVVKLLPDGIVNTGTAHSDDVLHQYEHNVTKNAAHRWADFVPGPLPRRFKVSVLNLTGVNVTASQLDVAIEYVKETL